MAKIDPREGPYLHGDIQEEWIISEAMKQKVICSTKSDKVILFVDDVFINLRMMGNLLNSMGIAFHMASSGEQAVEMCSKFKHEMIFLDYFMVGITGLEASEKIRNDDMNKETPIIILTANEYDEDIKNSGLGYIQKPINKHRLDEIINKSQ